MFVAIVPAYNEARHIGPVVRDLFRAVDRVVVIDDASQDQTAAEAAKAGAIVIRHRVNRGQGAALETGHAYARQLDADYILHFDGDGQFDVTDVEPALVFLQEHGADMLVGTRMVDGRTKTPWTKEHILFPLGRLFHRMFFGIRLTDVHNGFRILNRRALDRIGLTQDGMAHATEILVQAQKYHLTVVEFPVKVVYREYGQRARGALMIIRDLFFGRLMK